MKEIQEVRKDTLQIEAEKPIERQNKLVGSTRLHAGQKLWECNIETGEIAQVNYEDTAEIDFENKEARKRVTVKEGHLYCGAINKKNAVKHFTKMLVEVYKSMQEE